MEGQAWVFGNNIDTDNIFPTRFGGDATLEEMAKHAFYDYRPEFYKQVKTGDMIIAGYNFGCGSYRETAVISLKAMGIKAVIARSFSRAYYRNAVNNGIWIITIGNQPFSCEDGARIRIDPLSGVITNIATGETITGLPLSGFALDIVKAGGATSYFKPQVLYPEKGC